MRRLARVSLNSREVRYLAKKQFEIANGADIEITWKRARQTKRMKSVATTLKQITGIRERCMFCEDSRGTDIDHFRPKASFQKFVFDWKNFLWVCTGCNREKSSDFPVTDTGEPLLINPLEDNPWCHLFFDSDTDLIVAKIIPTSGQPDPRGVATLACLPTLSHQAIADGRRRTRRNLARAVRMFLSSAGEEMDADKRESELLESLADSDAYGLLAWFVCFDPTNAEPFATLKREYPRLWDRIGSSLNSANS